MATYSIKAPNGKTYQIDGPEGATQDQIQAQVLTQFPDAAGPDAALRNATPRKYAPRSAPAANPHLDTYNSIRTGLAQKFANNPAQQKIALDRFDSDPRAQQLRKLAGLAALSTRQGEVKQTARDRLNQAGADLGKNATGFQSAAAGIARGMFGIPEHLAAAAERFLPSAITGNRTNASYDNILQMIRAKDTAAIDANPGAGLAGEIGGNIVGANAAAKTIGAGARAIAARGIPVASRVAQAVESVGTLRKGQKLANAGKLAVMGGAAGGTQAAGEGSDIAEGTATGAIAAPVIAGGFKAAQVITRPFRDVLRLSSAGQILSRLTTVTRDQLEQRAAAYRAATGAEPTVFELLPLADRNKILKQAVVGRDNVVEAASNAIRRRAQNLGPEMSNRANQILRPQRRFVEHGLMQDITDARGGTPAVGDTELVQRAAASPTDMLHFRDEEARAIMAPHDATQVVPNLEDIFPSVPNPNGGAGVATDPEVQTVIRNAAGLVRQRTANAGVTVGDITDIISKLRPMLGNGGNDALVAERAINHLHDVLDTTTPDAGAAARQMRDAYAARSRMAEGMEVGHDTTMRDEIQVGTSRRRAQKVRNAFDTSEGSGGRTLGQGNRLINDLGGSPEEALRATVKISRNNIGRPLAQNVGPREAAEIQAAARAQDESAQALSAASNKAQAGSGDTADAETLVQAVAGLHPSSFITTKASAVRHLLDMTYIPENRARTIVDMLFSQDPALSSRALRAIGNEPNGAAAIKKLAATVGMQAAGIDGTDFVPDESTADSAPSAEDDLANAPAEEPEVPTAEGDIAGIEAPQSDSPYAAQLQDVYDNENPELIELVQRVKGQESGGHQLDENGQPVTSDKGATGIMQVMPDTGPEAAELAGVKWDPDAYQHDAAYNELIGIAYLSELLRKYDGDVDKALAAYNAGPGRTDEALSSHGDAWLAALPAETQDYVQRLG